MHPSPHTPEETQYVATMLADAGFPDDYIGAMLMYHYHDQEREGGASVEIVRDSGENFGLVVKQPSGPNYPQHVDAGRPAVIDIPKEARPDEVTVLLPEEES